MKPGKELASHSDRDLDIEKLWESLDRQAPGPIVDGSPKKTSKKNESETGASA